MDLTRTAALAAAQAKSGGEIRDRLEVRNVGSDDGAIATMGVRLDREWVSEKEEPRIGVRLFTSER